MDAGISSMVLKVYDVNGRIVFEDKVSDATNKNYELNIDVKSGMYFVAAKKRFWFTLSNVV